MGDQSTLRLEKESIELINKLKELWESQKLYFDVDFYGKAIDFHAKIDPTIGTQKWLNGQYTIEFIDRWSKYEHELLNDLIPHIQFIHRNKLQFDIFKKHKKDVLELLNEFNNHNTSILKTKYPYPFGYLTNSIRFWESLSQMQWNVREIEYSEINECLRGFTVTDYSSELYYRSFENYCNKTITFSLDNNNRLPLTKERLVIEITSNNPVPIVNLFGKPNGSKLYYRNMVTKCVDYLSQLGLFKLQKLKDRDDFVYPTIFLLIMKHIEFKKFINSRFFYCDNIIDEIDDITSNYCTLKDIEETQQVRESLLKYFEVLNDCALANFSATQFKSAHKLAAHKSGIKLT